MGVKELWTLLTPYCERKPICELQGKVVAIDLAGWVCASLNVVDYFVHPKQYLKNLFFRTSYLLLAGIIPVFVLEGKAPELKQDTITKRNCIQFRGNKPREETNQSDNPAPQNKKGRTRFNYVLRECEKLLETMGLKCVQAPGEAEAFCANLNRDGHVYGIISQDSDCFAYGAIRVFRNFSVSTQGNSSAAGGSVDIYDMEKITKAMDFGQNKIIAMAILCGCDYCPGVEGVGRDGIVKLFTRYKESDILEKIRYWRASEYKYTELEIKVDDKNVCANCGHHGKTFVHVKAGCSLCKTHTGCDWSLWKEKRLAIKAEINIRKQALKQEDFPSEIIIKEFLSRPQYIEKLDLKWMQPNLVRFVKTIGVSLQWTEIYCFEKFLPLLTRWLIFNYGENSLDQPKRGVVVPDFIKKKRAPKGIPSYEIVWKDEGKFFDCLIPDDQLQSYINENPKGLESLYSTIEAMDLTEKAFPTVVQTFLAKQKKPKATKKKLPSKNEVLKTTSANHSLSNMSDLLKATSDVEKVLKKRKKEEKENLPKIDNFFIHKSTPVQPKKTVSRFHTNCSTPKLTKSFCVSDLEDDDDFNYSDIITNIVSKPSLLKSFGGKQLKYDSIHYLNRSQDDLDLLTKTKRSFPFESPLKTSKKQALGDENDSFVKLNFSQDDSCIGHFKHIKNVVDRFLIREGKTPLNNKESKSANTSYFFEKSLAGVDAFELSLDIDGIENGKASSSDE